MQLSTTDVIKILPLEEAFKQELLAKMEQYDPGQRYAISQVIWDTFFAMYKYRLEDNVEQALEEVEKGQRSLGPTFYQDIQKQTEDEMQKEQVTVSTRVDLNDTRRKLEELMQTADKPGPN